MKRFKAITVAILTFSLVGVATPAQANSLVPTAETAVAVFSGEVDLQFNVSEPQKEDFDFICLTLDGKPVEQSDDESNLFAFVNVIPKGNFALGDIYDFYYTDKPKPMDGCLNAYLGNTFSTLQYIVEVSALDTTQLVNGSHTLKIQGFYPTSPSISLDFSFTTNNSSKTQILFHKSISGNQIYGSTASISGEFARGSEPAPRSVKVRILQKSGASKWSTLPVVNNKFSLKTMKLLSKTEIQVSANFNGTPRTYTNVVNLMPNITLSFTNLKVGKVSKTIIKTGGMKSGMCQLEVDDNAYWATTHALPVRNGVASISQTYNTMGTYSGKVICAGSGFVKGEKSFSREVALG